MWSRREMLGRAGMGFGMIALADMLGGDPASAQSSATNPLAARRPDFARAHRVIHLFMNGGPSHVDTFDPKPVLDKYHGQPLPTSLRTERTTGAAFRSPFQFTRHGQSGIEVSELFPHIARSVDDLCVIRSMYADVPNHEPSFMLMNCGDGRQVRQAWAPGSPMGSARKTRTCPASW